MYTDGSTYIEDDDQCNTCQYYARGIACPLLEALSTGVAVMPEPYAVQNCGFYVQFGRGLKLIKQ